MNFMRWMTLTLVAVFFLPAARAELVEIKLIEPLDETRGWCVDLFAHLTNAKPLGGFQGHNCFLYMGRGPTQDQGFDLETFEQEGKLNLAHFDVCMTLQEPNTHSYVGAEACEYDDAQIFTMNDDGEIKPVAAPQLCLTLGASTIPGGGRLAPVGRRPPESNEGIPQIRRVTFDTCSAEKEKLQRWTFRNGEFKEETRTELHRFLQ